MNNPRINQRLLRQALSSQFAYLPFRNGERDDFKAPYQELSGSQKRSLITLGNDLAQMELKVRLDNNTKLTQLVIEFEKFGVLRPDLIMLSQYVNTCSECDDACTHVFLTFQTIFNGQLEREQPYSFSWQVYCETHLPTLEE